MSRAFVDRTYEDIVRDVLTTLTGGTVRESLPAPPEGTLLVPEKLASRPVRRVSHLEGFTVLRDGADPVPYRFTAADFELVSSSGDGSGDGAADAIRFRDEGRKPAPGTRLTVNYYPVQTPPAPVTDLNVGSVVRTLLETVAREVAELYGQLERVYDSAFVDTAEGSSLDRVVALVGVRRLPAGHAVAKLRFTRREGSPGRITLPAGTPVTDAKGNRYLLLDELTLEPYETTREGLAGAQSPGVPPVDAGALDRLETVIAGISTVANPDPARRLASPETDDALRRRARGALNGALRGTYDALRFGLLSIPGVNDVSLVEAPNGVAGEVRADVAYATDDPAVREAVRLRIHELRPVGIRVIAGEAARVRVRVKVALTLAGSGVRGGELSSLTAGVEARLAEHLAAIAPGGTVRRARLASLALQDARIADASITLRPEGQADTAEMTLPEGQVLDVVRPFEFPTPAAENAAAAGAITSSVGVAIPVHLAPGITLENATSAITLAVDAHLASRRPDAPLTVDGLLAAVRDDSRFAAVRDGVIVTVESGEGRFRQLTDGVGDYVPAPNETLARGSVDVQPREGGA